MVRHRTFQLRPALERVREVRLDERVAQRGRVRGAPPSVGHARGAEALRRRGGQSADFADN